MLRHVVFLERQGLAAEKEGLARSVNRLLPSRAGSRFDDSAKCGSILFIIIIQYPLRGARFTTPSPITAEAVCEQRTLSALSELLFHGL